MTLIGYLLKKFIAIFIGAVMFFVVVLELIDILGNLWRYMAEDVTSTQIGWVMLLYIPKTISFSVPLAILFAVSYIISDFYAKNELTSIFASGVSLIQFVWPLLALSLLLSGGMFFFENYVVVPTYREKMDTQKVLLKQETSYSNDRVVVLADEGRTVYKANFYDDVNRRLYDLYVIYRDSGGNLKAILRTSTASWRDDRWAFSTPWYYIYEDDELKQVPLSEDLVINEPPDTFRSMVISVDEVNAADARRYIEYLRRVGLPYAEAQSQYYEKFSYPLVVFIVVFLSIGLSGKSRKNVLLMSLLMSVSSAVLYYVTQMVTMLLARFEYITPLAGAWFPVILFIIVSIVCIRFART
jgi:lipopolysaccharide export system permease protein